MKIIVLGSGTSHGIPVAGCSCPVCTSNDERDKRMRSSVYIEGQDGERVLIDAGPEFRLQAIRAGISRLDGILLTHSHADHLHGLDDLRPFSCAKPIPVYGNAETISEMKERFSYIFKITQNGGGKPKLIPNIADETIHIGGLTITPVPVKHGELDILGWEISETTVKETQTQENVSRSFLYLTDVSEIPPASITQLSNRNSDMARIIIIGSLRMRPHETHFSFDEALAAALALGPSAVYLTHICHNHSHGEIEEICRAFREKHQTLPKQALADNIEKIDIHPAQDGLELIL